MKQEYKQIKAQHNFSSEFPTWIIGYCPDTDSFFVTNQRFFFWEYNDEFQCENDAINYFRNHAKEFADIRYKIACECGGIYSEGNLFLENTKEMWNYKGLKL